MIKTEELKQKSADELKQELEALNRELFNLRMQKAAQSGGVVRTHQFKSVKRQIARVKTFLHAMGIKI